MTQSLERNLKQAYNVIIKPLIFAPLYWLLYVTWCKITEQLPRYNPGLSSDYFRRKETKPVEESQLNYLTQKKNTLFRESSKTVATASASDKHFFMQAVSRDMKINRGVGYKINKPLSDLLILRLIMSLAEKLSSKLHIFSRSFASRPNILLFVQCIGREHY